MDLKELHECYDEIFLEAVQALANAKIPEFANHTEDEVFEAFNTAFNLRDFQYQTWIEWFQRSVSIHSLSMVSLEKVRFTTGIRGRTQTFLLKYAGKERKVVLGPYVPPVMFWGEESEEAPLF